MSTENKRLMKIEVSFDMVIVVDSDANIGECDKIARQSIKEAVDDMSRKEFDVSIEAYENNAKYWDGDCVPYGGDGKTRIKDYKI